ncbi:hypothetical protein ACP4OV_025528 [Aristida adscensionis]
MEASTVFAALVGGMVVALVVAANGWVRRAEERSREVRRLARFASRELEIAEREAEADLYNQRGGFVGASGPAAGAAPSRVAVAVAPPRVEVEVAAAASPPAASPVGKGGACAECGKPTTLRCKRCKAVKYCTFKCQTAHWRKGHKDGCNPLGVCASIENVTAKVTVGTVGSGMPSDEASHTAEASADGHGVNRLKFVTGQAEYSHFSRLSTSSKPSKVHATAVSENFCHTAHDHPAGLKPELNQASKQAGSGNLERFRHLSCMPGVDKVPSTHSGAYPLASNPSKREANLPGPSVVAEGAGVMQNNLPTEKKNARQQTAQKSMSHYPTELILLPYKHFVNLYSFEKVELHPFGLYNLGNSCYANAVLQCLAFTRPLTAYLLEGHHSQTCSKKEWCFLCELEKLIVEGKRGNSPVSPMGILSHLHEIGCSFDTGTEEDAHEFLRWTWSSRAAFQLCVSHDTTSSLEILYAIDTMQSASMKEAKKNIDHPLAEETTLVQLTFGGYLRSKIKCTKCKISSERRERFLDLAVEINGKTNSLEDALRRFTSSEIIDGDNRYNCSRCNSYERAKKKLTISEAPNILTITFKRYQTGKSGKIRKVIKFGEILNLSEFMSSKDDHAPVYNLYAVVVHHDVMNSAVSGHYVCYIKDPQGMWHEMDDSKVKPVCLDKVLSNSAYMLLYSRYSPRAPSVVRKVMLAQGKSRRKKLSQKADSVTTSGGESSLSSHQGGRLHKDQIVDDLKDTVDTSSDSPYRVQGFRRRGSSPLFSNSDAGSTRTLSSDSTGSSTGNSSSMEEYDYVFGRSDQMRPVNRAAIPLEQELGYSRQRSSLNPSSSGQDDQSGEFERLYQHRHQAGKGVWQGGKNSPFFYTDQGGQYATWDPMHSSHVM